MHEGAVTQCTSKAQYTLTEQFSPTAPKPKNGYALKVQINVTRTLKGEPAHRLDLFVVDPETKHASAPVQGKPNVVVGAHVYVGFIRGGSAIIWVVDGHDLMPKRAD